MPRPERALDGGDPWTPFAARLRSLRRSTNLTYQELAERTHYSAPALSMAASGRTAPAWDKVVAYLEGCGVTDPEQLATWRGAYDDADQLSRCEPDADEPAVAMPDGARSWAQLAAGLDAVRREAGLSYRQITSQSGGRLSLSTISGLLSGRTEPGERTLREFLAACHVSSEDTDQWLAARRRIRSGGADGAPSGDAAGHQPGVDPAGPDLRFGLRPHPGIPAGQPAENTEHHTRLATAPAAGRSVGTSTMQVIPGRRRGPNSSRAGRYTSLGEPRIAAALAVRAPADLLRDLARRGDLARAVATATPAERQALTAAAYELVWPIVFARLTRPMEQRRGHRSCAAGVERLADDCLDRFHDDVEAVVDDLLTHTRQPVEHLEAWVAARLRAATVDGNRRRRGQRGALQRPRVPGWLHDTLGHDTWLTRLSINILEWVGVPTPAGADVWPVEAWAQQRGAVTGDWAGSDTATVRCDIETVLTAMRRRPLWYEEYVERPLGYKTAPVAVAGFDETAQPLLLTDSDQQIDAELQRLSADAVSAIQRRSGTGEPATEVVLEVIREIFGQRLTSTDLDHAPHAVADPLGGLSGALADQTTVDRIVTTVRHILDGR
jgi:transcriptional regulator with XRE-family HTH domain